MLGYREWMRSMLWGNPLRQVLATVVLVVALLVVFAAVHAFRRVLSRRYDHNLVEIVEEVAMAPWIVAAAYLFAEIWAIPFIFDRVVGAVLVDRWTGAQQFITAAILVAAYLLVRAINRSIDRMRSEGAITDHQKEVAYHVADIGIFAAAGVVILSVWGVSLTNLIIGAGAASAVLGLAARQTVAAVIAGFVLLLARPFRVGDWIEVSNANGENDAGIVQDVTLVHTKIRTFNDEHALVSNDVVTTNRLINYSRNDRLRIDLEIGVDYEADLGRAREVIVDAVSDLDRVSDSPSPRVVGKRFGDSAVVLELHFWIDDPDRERAWMAQTDVIEAVDDALDRAGITIPFPQRTHEFREGALDVAADASDSPLELD